LEILDAAEAKNVTDAFSDLDFGVVREETVGCSMFTDKDFKSIGHLGFTFHTVGATSLELCFPA
jgi:hypothetical protein